MSDVVIVTGATGGLGSELVTECSIEENADQIGSLFGVCRDKDKFIAMGLHERCQCFIHDALAPGSSYSHLLELIGESDPRGIVCIHTAFSISPIVGIGNMTEDQIFDNIQCNVTDTVKLINSLMAYSREMCAEIRFVNMDSGAARRPIQGWSLYCSSKAYINMLLQCCALDLPTFSFVSYDPGVVDTGMQEEIRSVPEEDFPDRSTFEAYKVKGELHSPQAVSKDIVRRFVAQSRLSNAIEKFRS